jgi:hypothetical protein
MPLSQSLPSGHSPPVPCVFGISDLVSNDEVPIPCLHVPSPQRPSARAAATSLADSALKFLFHIFHPVLLWFRVIVMMRFLFHVLCFLVPPPPPVPLFALALPRRLVDVADGLLGMVHIDFFLFFFFFFFFFFFVPDPVQAAAIQSLRRGLERGHSQGAHPCRVALI